MLQKYVVKIRQANARHRLPNIFSATDFELRPPWASERPWRPLALSQMSVNLPEPTSDFI